VSPGHRTECDRCVIGSKDRGPSFWDTFVHRLCSDGHAVDITELALVGTKSHSGVALYMFNGFKPFSGSEFNSRCSNIGLVIHELLGCTTRGFGVRNMEQGHNGPLLYFHCFCDLDFSRGPTKTGVGRSLGTLTGTLFQTRVQTVATVNGTRDELFLNGLTRYKCGNIITPFRATTRMAREVYCWAPATGTGYGVTVQRPHITGHCIACGINASNGNATDTMTTFDLDNSRTGNHFKPTGFSCFNGFAIGVGTGI